MFTVSEAWSLRRRARRYALRLSASAATLPAASSCARRSAATLPAASSCARSSAASLPAASSCARSSACCTCSVSAAMRASKLADCDCVFAHFSGVCCLAKLEIFPFLYRTVLQVHTRDGKLRRRAAKGRVEWYKSDKILKAFPGLSLGLLRAPLVVAPTYASRSWMRHGPVLH